jgi:hypothetical protein
MNVSTNSVIHRRFKCFVKYIAPEEEKRQETKDKADEIRRCIEGKAARDGYTVLSAPSSGSFATKTGLRRSLRGNDEVEGQDVDIAFILADKDKDGNDVGCMVETFEGYLNETWPGSDICSTKSSATIFFSTSKLRFDAVPLLKTGREGIQRLIRTNNEERQSSIDKHNEFTRKRTDTSNAIEGVVRFNECVRLVKWWRYHKQSKSTVFGNGDGDEKIPSFLLILLCATAYDKCSVTKTYAETLSQWFGFLAHVVRNRKAIVFNDFIKTHTISEDSLWTVCDPMDDTNNVVRNWGSIKIDELAEWFEHARDKMNQAIRHNDEGEDQASLECLIELFGNSISNQCKDA